MIRSKDVALKEGQRAANIIGAQLLCGESKAKELPYGVTLIENINKLIDDLNIDLIYTHWVHDIHQDHRAAGLATLNAARHVPRILMYRSNWYATTIPFNARLYVDISSTIKTKIKAIKAHKSEYQRYGEEWINFVLHQNRNDGIEIGVEYAETFEVVRYLI